MSEDIQSVLEKATRKILGPLIRLLLRNGVACGTFESIVRQVYVDEAFSIAEQSGKATVSSVSAQTGLSRKEVKRLRELTPDDGSGNSQKYNRAVRVISGWMNDPRFMSTEGVPLALDMDDSEHGFASLVKDYSGDIPTRAMFDLLQKSGCVEKQGDKVYLVSHAYVPGNDPVDAINILGTDSRELMNTIEHNMACESSQRRFQRKVSTGQLAASEVDAFRKYASRNSQKLLEQLDSWLAERESQSKDDARYVSVGIYYYQDPSNEENES